MYVFSIKSCEKLEIMKTRRRILGVRRNSTVRSPNRNLWFFSDGNIDSQSVQKEIKSARNDRISIMKEDFDRYSSDQSVQDRSKKECTFIVDWQLSDNL